MPCIFPFEYKGVAHNQCTWDSDAGNSAWCSTKVDNDGKHIGGHGNWGNCASKCPTAPKSVKDIDVQRTKGRFQIPHNNDMIII